MKLRLALFGIVLFMCSSIAIGTENKTEFFGVFIDGKKVGYSTHARKIFEGKVMTSEMMDITINRGGTIAEIRIEQSSVETIDGKPISFEAFQKVSDTEIAIKGILNTHGKVDVFVTTADSTKKSTINWPKDALMAEGLRLLKFKNGIAEGISFKALIFDPFSLQPREVKIYVGPTKTIDLLGRKVELIEIKTISKTPSGVIPSTAYTDENLNIFKIILPIIGMRCEFVSCSRQYALGKNDIEDLLGKILIPSPVPLEGISSAKSITYELVPIGKNKLAIPFSNNQTVRVKPDGSVIVTVQPNSAPTRKTFPYTGSEKIALKAMKTSMFLQSDKEEIINLARKVVGNTKDTIKAVRQVELFVSFYISEEETPIGYAPALEIVASRKGDCSEHAILTVAMCRALGIPAQVVTGIVYAGQIIGHGDVFVSHAWARVYIGNKWFDIDATRIPTSFGPGHIALSYSNGNPENILSSLGQFKITRVIIRK